MYAKCRFSSTHQNNFSFRGTSQTSLKCIYGIKISFTFDYGTRYEFLYFGCPKNESKKLNSSRLTYGSEPQTRSSVRIIFQLVSVRKIKPKIRVPIPFLGCSKISVPFSYKSLFKSIVYNTHFNCVIEKIWIPPVWDH